MRHEDLPVPPSFGDLTAWAGAGQVVRADPAEMAGWRLPAAQKAALIESGVPIIGGLIDAVTLRPEPSFYRLAETSPAVADGLPTTFRAEPETGRVFWVAEPDGSTWFVNSSINHWLCSLHALGGRLAVSTVLAGSDEDDEDEDAALAELADLADEIRSLDPAAFQGDDHSTWFWPATLDRWLY